jgi:Fe-S cluster biogenesis protein NfuA
MDFQKHVQRIEELICEIEEVADAETRARAVELVQSLMEFHGAGLERMMEMVAELGEPGYAAFDNFARDGLVSSLLLLYGLHPLDLEARVRAALERVRPLLATHGGSVELLGVSEGTVRLRLEGSCNGCASSAQTLEATIEEAIYEAAPDLMALEVEGVVEQQRAAPSALVQLQPSKLKGKATATLEVDSAGSI